MESNIARDEVLGAESPSEPHFDEEATLLSARPVIPLHEVRAEGRFRRRLTFGVTIIVSILIGAVGATLIYKRGQKQTAQIVENSSQVSEQTGQEGPPITEADGGAANSHSAAPPAAGTSDDVVASKLRNGSGSTSSRKSAPVPPIPQSRESGSVEREMRYAQRVEARRLRLRAVREARRDGRKGQSADDLLRIREIFEGSPRP
jgi:hypothetical protein